MNSSQREHMDAPIQSWETPELAHRLGQSSQWRPAKAAKMISDTKSMLLLTQYVKFNVYSCYLEISRVHIRPNSNFLRVTEIAPTSVRSSETAKKFLFWPALLANDRNRPTSQPFFWGFAFKIEGSDPIFNQPDSVSLIWAFSDEMRSVSWMWRSREIESEALKSQDWSCIYTIGKTPSVVYICVLLRPLGEPLKKLQELLSPSIHDFHITCHIVASLLAMSQFWGKLWLICCTIRICVFHNQARL
jgi:hypothetical protein